MVVGTKDPSEVNGEWVGATELEDGSGVRWPTGVGVSGDGWLQSRRVSSS